MVLKMLLASAAVLALGGPVAVSAQTTASQRDRANAPTPCKPPPAQPKAAPALDRSTEPVSADPMHTASDTLTPATTTARHPPGKPPTFHSASMPSDDSMPSGSQPGDPMAPSPMAGSGP